MKMHHIILCSLVAVAVTVQTAKGQSVYEDIAETTQIWKPSPSDARIEDYPRLFQTRTERQTRALEYKIQVQGDDNGPLAHGMLRRNVYGSEEPVARELTRPKSNADRDSYGPFLF